MKVKINRVRAGSTGDQRDYGLVTGSIWNRENITTNNNVTDTLSPSEREDSVLEAEKGETIVTPDMKHFKIGGKRHSEGGTPLDENKAPDNSFIYSDTPSMKIKNKDVLKNVFNMNSSKKGTTPADVAKRYDLNKYQDMLNDPETDPMTKKTAQMMIDNNMKKLGQLALLQEGMKGFPDGIPAIAQPLMGSDVGQSQQSMKTGGSTKYQKGSTVYSDKNNVMVDHYDPQTGEPVYYGKTFKDVNVTGDRIPPNISYSNLTDEDIAAGRNYHLNASSGLLDWIIPMGVGAASTYAGVQGIKQIPKAVVKYIEKNPQYWEDLMSDIYLRKEYLKGFLPESLGAAAKGLLKGVGYLAPGAIYAGYNAYKDANKPMDINQNQSVANPDYTSITPTIVNTNNTPIVIDNTPIAQPDSTGTIVTPIKTPVSKKPIIEEYNPDDADTSYKSQKLGGSLDRYQNAGQTGFNQYTQESQISSTPEYSIVNPNKNFGKFFTQHYDPTKGYYTVTNPKTKSTEDMDMNDFISRHENILNQYGSGLNEWKQDAVSTDENVRRNAIGFFQENYDKWRIQNGLKPYFYGKSAKDPYGIDQKFGIYTWSAPGIKPKEKQVQTTVAPQEKSEEIFPSPKSPLWDKTVSNTDPGYNPADLIGFMAAATQKIPKSRAVSAKINPSLMSPVYLDPNFDPIMQAQLNAQKEYGISPQGRASAMGVTGKALEAANAESMNNRRTNLDSYLRSASANMGALNQANAYNAQETVRYNDYLNALAQSQAANENAKSALIAEKFAPLTNNRLKLQGINAMYPGQHSDFYNGTVVNPYLTSINQSPLTPTGAGSIDPATIYTSTYQDILSKTGDAEQAKGAAAAAVRYYQGLYSKSGSSGAYTSPFDLMG
jgi:hypothetical protein